MTADDAASPDLAEQRALAEALPHLVWFARPDGTVVYYNGRAALYDGLLPDDGGTYEWAPIVHPDDLELTQEAWARAVEQREPYECEHRIRMADGSYRWHLSRALPIDRTPSAMWFGTATDTQVLVDTREALRESESRLRSVFSGIDQGYCVCELVLDDDGTPVDYLFLEANPQFETATGLRDAVGRTALELVPDLEPHWVETYAAVALDGSPLRFEQESPAMGRHFDVFAMPVAPRGRFALVFADVTARKATERALAVQRNRDHEIAVRLQEALLPTALVDHPRLDIAAAYVTGTTHLRVGGDWYETLALRDGRVGIVVGDVVGHTTESAAAMGQLRAGLLALAPSVASPGDLLCELDHFAQRHRITDFATALCLFLDPDDGTIVYSSAGHPPALVCAPSGAVRWLEDGRALPLGGFSLDHRPDATEVLEPGAVLGAYSDGLVERRGEDIDVGLERLARTVAQHRDEGMRDLCTTTLQVLAGASGFADDTVLVTLRRTR